jgi:hypothetical protein
MRMVRLPTPRLCLPYRRIISDFLREIQIDVQIDSDALANAYWSVVGSEADKLLARHSFQLAERIKLNRDVFLTEKANVLFLEFQIAYRCTDVSGMDRGEAVLTLTGDGFYDAKAQQFSKLAALREALRFRDAEGVDHNPTNVYLRAGPITFGQANVAIRSAIDWRTCETARAPDSLRRS